MQKMEKLKSGGLCDNMEIMEVEDYGEYYKVIFIENF